MSQSSQERIKIHSQSLCVSNESRLRILKDISLVIPINKVIAFIGPSGCGKTVLLQCFNKTLDSTFKTSGNIFLDDQNIDEIDVVELRGRVGMISQKPNPFPSSIYENVASGPRLHGLYATKAQLDEMVKNSLEQVGLWDEVKDYFYRRSGFDLSVGQQQRLCIARALMVNPEVLLMDEPCSALDPMSTQRIQELLRALSHRMTIVIVTDRIKEMRQMSDRTFVFYQGRLIEENDTAELFKNPQHPLTREYLLLH